MASSNFNRTPMVISVDLAILPAARVQGAIERPATSARRNSCRRRSRSASLLPAAEQGFVKEWVAGREALAASLLREWSVAGKRRIQPEDAIKAPWRRPRKGGQSVLIVLCLLAGFSALAGLSSAAAVLLLGLGVAGLAVSLGFGVVSLGAGLWAAVLAFAPRPA